MTLHMKKKKRRAGKKSRSRAQQRRARHTTRGRPLALKCSVVTSSAAHTPISLSSPPPIPSPQASPSPISCFSAIPTIPHSTPRTSSLLPYQQQADLCGLHSSHLESQLIFASILSTIEFQRRIVKQEAIFVTIRFGWGVEVQLTLWALCGGLI